ncbi:hypothetical protein [Streptomyces sp. 900105755]
MSSASVVAVTAARAIGAVCTVTSSVSRIRPASRAWVRDGQPGAAAELFGAVRRPDGQVQITVGGWPVHRFSGDSKPGDLNGQGLDGKWFAVAPTGQKAAQ